MKRKKSVHEMRGYEPNGLYSDEDLPTSVMEEAPEEGVIDLNEVQPELDRLVVPAGVYRARCKVIPNDDGDDLTLSMSGFTRYLKIHNVITKGKYKGSIIRDQINVELTDAKPPPEKADNYKMAVAMGRALVRAIIEADRGIAPNDDSPKACRQRKIREWGEIDGIVCSIRVGIKPASNGYPERNVVLGVVQRDDRDDDDE